MERPTKKKKKNPPSTHSNPNNVIKNGLIIVHRCNLNCFSEWMPALVNNCINALFFTEYSISKAQLKEGFEGYNFMWALQSLPKIDNSMAFLTDNGFIGGDGNN